IPLTGNFVLTTAVPGGSSVPGRKLRVLNGRRGPMAPGPGCALLIRCERCRCNPWDPRYPNSSVVSAPKLFSTDPLHCSMYCGGGSSSKDAKLTVVAPNTAGPKLKCVATTPAAGVKLSLCCVSGNT